MTILILKNKMQITEEAAFSAALAIQSTALSVQMLLPVGAMSQQGITPSLYELIEYQFKTNRNDCADGKPIDPYAIKNIEAVCNLIEHCRNSKQLLIEPFLSILKDQKLVAKDDTVTETIRDIVLSAAENKGEKMRLNFFRAVNVLLERCNESEKPLIEPFLSILNDQELITENYMATETIRDIVFPTIENNNKKIRVNLSTVMSRLA